MNNMQRGLLLLTLTIFVGCSHADDVVPAGYHEVAQHDLTKLVGAPAGWALSVHDPVIKEGVDAEFEREEPTFTCLHVPDQPTKCQPQLAPDRGDPAGLKDVEVSAEQLWIDRQWQPVIRLSARSVSGVSGWEVVTRFLKPEGKTLTPAGTITQSNMANIFVLRDGPLKGAVLTAEAQWMGQEAHYEDHHFLITALAPTGYGFRTILSYLTLARYPPEQEGVPLINERQKVESLFQLLYGDAPDLRRTLLPPDDSTLR